MHYKAPDNSLHFIDPAFEHMLPAGSVPITDEEAAALAPQPDPELTRAAKLAEVRELREGILNRLAGIAFAAQLEGDTATTAAYITARLALLDITKNLPTDPVQIEDAVKQRWASIVGQCTPQMVSAFLQVDA